MEKDGIITTTDYTMLPDYSVFISVYSKVNPTFFKESLDSIINQTYKPKEIILVKDGPLNDELDNIISEYENNYANLFKILKFEQNKGAGEAYNLAIKKCTCKYGAIMDSDDIADLTKFEKQMIYLNNHPRVDVIGTNAIEFIDNKENVVSTRIMPETDDELKKFAHGRCPMIQPTVVFRVQAVKDAGSYQNSKLTEDYDLYIRMIKNGCIFHTFQEILYYIRTSEDFFSRRGGIKYLKPILGFKYKHYKSGFFTFKEFIKTSTASLIVSLMPNKLRTFFYKKFLRK